MSEVSYTRQFYRTRREGSRRSARLVIPLILRLVQPRTVVDVGCGDGSWLAVLNELGVADTLGIDGQYVERELLRIPQDRFIAMDLSQPLRLDRVFDLALSLEVAEHLPPESAGTFVHSLTQLAPVVLFSAAIPFQRGLHHLNEQWPDYWVALFKNYDYFPIDAIRGELWENGDIEWWYVQNALLFASAARIQNDPVLRREYERTNPRQLRIVHPGKYLEVAPPPQYKVREAYRLLIESLKRSARWRTRGMFRGKNHG